MAGGKSYLGCADCVPPTEIIGGLAFAAVKALDAGPIDAACNGSCAAIVRVTLGITVLLNRSPPGFFSGRIGAAVKAVVGSTGLGRESFARILLTRLANGIVMAV